MSGNNYLRVCKTDINKSAKADKDGVKKPWFTNVGWAYPFKEGNDPESIGYSISLDAIPGTDQKGHFHLVLLKAKETVAPKWDLGKEVSLLDKDDQPIEKKKIGDLRFSVCGQRTIINQDDSIIQKSPRVGFAYFKTDAESGEKTFEMDLDLTAMPMPKSDPATNESKIFLRIFMPKSDLKSGNGDAAETEEVSEEIPF